MEKYNTTSFDEIEWGVIKIEHITKTQISHFEYFINNEKLYLKIIKNKIDEKEYNRLIDMMSQSKYWKDGGLNELPSNAKKALIVAILSKELSVYGG